MNPKQKELHFYIYEDKVNNELLPEKLLSQHQQEKIINAIGKLPGPYNIILQDYYINEKTSGEIMQNLNISRDKFYNYLHKGKFLLRQEVNKSYYDRANKILYDTK